jgi:hypothetical protein
MSLDQPARFSRWMRSVPYDPSKGTYNGYTDPRFKVTWRSG